MHNDEKQIGMIKFENRFDKKYEATYDSKNLVHKPLVVNYKNPISYPPI